MSCAVYKQYLTFSIILPVIHSDFQFTGEEGQTQMSSVIFQDSLRSKSWSKIKNPGLMLGQVSSPPVVHPGQG